MLRSLISVFCLSIATIFVQEAASANWPERPIRLIVPYAPGSSSDTIARIVTAKMRDQLGLQVIVDNRVGGSTIVGTLAVARSAPDGYTIGLANTSSHVITPLLNPNSEFDPLRDFAPIGMIGASPLMLISSTHLPATTVRQFIDLAKAKPGSLSYATAGSGTVAHLAGELFKYENHINVVHVPYRGTEQALLDIMEGRIDLAVSPIPPTIVQIKQGTVRALAVMSDKRSDLLPDVPTVDEAGIPDCEAALWTAVVAPAGTPNEIIDRLSQLLIQAVKDPDVRKALETQGVLPQPGPPETVTTVISADTAKWRQVAARIGLIGAQ
jgi:tripartite-type tricarboxylate transporter receptor subunit TctC